VTGFQLKTQEGRCRIRLPRADDEGRLFAWRNLPWIVRRGESRRRVTREEHSRWFSETLAGKRHLYLIEVGSTPAGMVRFDQTDSSTVEASLYLLPFFVSHGYGTKAFAQALVRLAEISPGVSLVARTLGSNRTAKIFFEKWGFSLRPGRAKSGLLFLSRKSIFIAHSRPTIPLVDVEKVSGVLNSQQLALGVQGQRLEEAWAKAIGRKVSAAVGSGVGALRLSLLALDVGKGDEVIVPAYSCVALPNAVLALGARPVLADVEKDSWVLTPKTVRSLLTRRTKAIVAVHLFGEPAPVPELRALGTPVIEDCSHGIGGRWKGRRFGSMGDLSFSSFYATKMIGAGEGGIVAGDDPSRLEKVRRARDYGDQFPDGRHLNDKMTDVEASLALSQLGRLADTLRRRSERAAHYRRRLAPWARRGLLVLPSPTPGRVWYRFAIRLVRHLAVDVAGQMWGHGVRAEQPVWDFREWPDFPRHCPVTESAFDRVLSLPLYPNLTTTEQEYVCASLEKVLESS
jgi:perosamine synthetase